jgi:hypothetical protein
MKNTPNNTQNILEDMKKITMLTGEISNIHQKSLMTWPYVVFDSVENVEIKYDLSKSTQLAQQHNLIEFFISINQVKKTIDNFEKRCQTLESWVENMLWSGIDVKIYINNTLEYPGVFRKNNEPNQDG